MRLRRCGDGGGSGLAPAGWPERPARRIPTPINKFGDWVASTYDDSGKTLCYATSEPKKQAGKFTEPRQALYRRHPCAPGQCARPDQLCRRLRLQARQRGQAHHRQADLHARRAAEGPRLGQGFRHRQGAGRRHAQGQQPDHQGHLGARHRDHRHLFPDRASPRPIKPSAPPAKFSS